MTLYNVNQPASIMDISIVVKNGRFAGVKTGPVVINYLQDIANELYKILPQYSTGKDNLLSHLRTAAEKYSDNMILCGIEDAQRGILSDWWTPATTSTFNAASHALQSIIKEAVTNYMRCWKPTLLDNCYDVASVEFDSMTQKAIVQTF